MTISLHIVADNCPPDQLDRALLYLQRVKPPTVDIAAGAELIKGMQFAERVKRDVPGIKIIWRNLEIEDTGIHAKMSALAVYQNKVSPHLDWFKRNEIVFMPDNESSGNDNAIRKYVQWQVEMAVLLHGDNLRGAFCRFSTGTIDDGGKGSNQYPLLKPIFSAMLPGDYVSPNEYSGQPGVSSGGHLERYKLMWKAAERELPTLIGEAGVAMNYDPGKGYIDAGMTDEVYGQQMLNEEIWYLDGKVDRHMYLIGGYTHEGYRLHDGVLKHWENHYAKRPPVVVAPPPPPDVIWIRAKVHLKFGASVNLRAAPDVTSADLGDITGYSPIEYDSSSPKNGWYHVRYQEIVGYASADYFEPTSDEPPRLPYVPVQANLGGAQAVTIKNNGNGYALQAIASNDHVQKVGQLSDGERVTLYRSTYTTVGGVIWYYLARDSTPVGESAIGWIPYNLPPPPAETPPPIREYVIKVVITATEEQTAQIAAGAVSLFDFMATFSDAWKGVRPQIVIEDMSQVAQGANA